MADDPGMAPARLSGLLAARAGEGAAQRNRDRLSAHLSASDRAEAAKRAARFLAANPIDLPRIGPSDAGPLFRPAP